VKILIILSLDPSTVATGYAVIDSSIAEENLAEGLLEYGTIKPKPTARLSDRIRHIYDALQDIIEKHRPDAIVTEDQFGGQITAVKALSQVRGAIMLLASQNNLPMYLLAPTQIKKAITGIGNASKDKVIDAVRRTFKINDEAERLTSDMADAIAAGYTYLNYDIKKLRTA
jgi:crossover junction endodeoxyribonuclease RuvC